MQFESLQRKKCSMKTITANISSSGFLPDDNCVLVVAKKKTSVMVPKLMVIIKRDSIIKRLQP
jgi:hypothetical protein